MLSNTLIDSSPNHMKIRYRLEKIDWQLVLTALQNNQVKYNSDSIINSIKLEVYVGSQHE